MSFFGLISLPVLLLSIVFIFFHTKFIRLYDAYNGSRILLHKLRLHKLELLLFFLQEIEETFVFISTETELSQNIANLEEKLSDFSFTDEDSCELADISKEIDEAQHMYNQAKEYFDSFTSKFPGKYLATFLADKSMK